MILVMGGAYQGKLAFAFGLLGQELGGEGPDRDFYADGHTDPYERAFEKKIVYGLHAYVRRLMEEGKSPNIFIEELTARNPSALVVTDEVGCGIVPAQAIDRAYREAAGRACVQLARGCGSVYRVLCGIGMRIK